MTQKWKNTETFLMFAEKYEDLNEEEKKERDIFVKESISKIFVTLNDLINLEQILIVFCKNYFFSTKDLQEKFDKEVNQLINSRHLESFNEALHVVAEILYEEGVSIEELRKRKLYKFKKEAISTI